MSCSKSWTGELTMTISDFISFIFFLFQARAAKAPVPFTPPQIVMSPVAEEDQQSGGQQQRRVSHHVRYGSLDSLREFLPPQDVKEEGKFF